MFDWLGDIISGIGSAIGDTIDFIGSGVGDAIWNAMLKWLYEIIYGAIADFFEMMGNMGSEVFNLEWVQATVKLFTLFGWGLFVAGTVVAVFDVAIEYQCGRANIKTTALNILKGFFACSLIGIVPIELYKFCISLQNTFSHDLVGIASGGINESLSDAGLAALAGMFSSAVSATYGLLNLLCMIAFAYCVIKMFFANIKRGGILLIQIAVGSLYMFSVPRGYAEGFNQWCKGNPYAKQLLHSVKSNRHLSAAMGSFRLLHHLARMLQNQLEDERKEKLGGIDRKLKRKIDEKKQAHGLKQ